jgi:hypothetical protein
MEQPSHSKTSYLFHRSMRTRVKRTDCLTRIWGGIWNRWNNGTQSQSSNGESIPSRSRRRSIIMEQLGYLGILSCMRMIEKPLGGAQSIIGYGDSGATTAAPR